jgi:hypothetical protein
MHYRCGWGRFAEFYQFSVDCMYTTLGKTLNPFFTFF